jgi:hypothetical protein
MTLWKILPCDLRVGDKVVWWDGTSMSLIEVVEADGKTHETDQGTWVYHFRLQGEDQVRQIAPGERIIILARDDAS